MTEHDEISRANERPADSQDVDKAIERGRAVTAQSSGLLAGRPMVVVTVSRQGGTEPVEQSTHEAFVDDAGQVGKLYLDVTEALNKATRR